MRIAKALGVERRYVGEEPTSQVTALYNAVMQQALAREEIECIVVPRKEQEGAAISASTVRKTLQQQGVEAIRSMVPETTYAYFASEAAQPVLDAIRKAAEVVHH